MARESLKARERKRESLVAKYAKKRALLKAAGDFAGLDKWMADKKVGDVASFHVKRDGLARTFELTIAQTPMKAFVIQSVESPNATQLALRKKWLSL